MERGQLSSGGPDRLVAAALAAATVGVYMLGAGRTYSFDSSTTVGYFVAVPGLLTPLLNSKPTPNNHPLFSLLDHLVYMATGRSDEATMRFLPILIGGLAVGLIYLAVRRYLGRAAGIVAAVALAANATFAANAREVRGYSLLALCAIVATATLVRLLTGSSTRRRDIAVYVASLAAGIATHLFGALLIPLHLAVILALRQPLRRWARAWALAVACGCLVYLPAVPGLLAYEQGRGRAFHRGFPLELAASLVGGSWGDLPRWPLLLTAVTACGGLLALRGRRWLQPVVGVGAAMVAALWLAGFADLAPRFFTWMVPGVAGLQGAAVARYRALAPVALLGTVALGAGQIPGWGRDLPGYRLAGAFANREAAAARTTCVPPQLTTNLQPIRGYTGAFREIKSPADMGGCDSLIVIDEIIDPRFEAAARSRFAFHAYLPGGSFKPVIYSNREVHP